MNAGRLVGQRPSCKFTFEQPRDSYCCLGDGAKFPYNDQNCPVKTDVCTYRIFPNHPNHPSTEYFPVNRKSGGSVWQSGHRGQQVCFAASDLGFSGNMSGVPAGVTANTKTKAWGHWKDGAAIFWGAGSWLNLYASGNLVCDDYSTSMTEFKTYEPTKLLAKPSNASESGSVMNEPGNAPCAGHGRDLDSMIRYEYCQGKSYGTQWCSSGSQFWDSVIKEYCSGRGDACYRVYLGSYVDHYAYLHGWPEYDWSSNDNELMGVVQHEAFDRRSECVYQKSVTEIPIPLGGTCQSSQDDRSIITCARCRDNTIPNFSVTEKVIEWCHQNPQRCYPDYATNWHDDQGGPILHPDRPAACEWLRTQVQNIMNNENYTWWAVNGQAFKQVNMSTLISQDGSFTDEICKQRSS
jgi:hypothetical protein